MIDHTLILEFRQITIAEKEQQTKNKTWYDFIYFPNIFSETKQGSNFHPKRKKEKETQEMKQTQLTKTQRR